MTLRGEPKWNNDWVGVDKGVGRMQSMSWHEAGWLARGLEALNLKTIRVEGLTWEKFKVVVKPCYGVLDNYYSIHNT